MAVKIFGNGTITGYEPPVGGKIGQVIQDVKTDVFSTTIIYGTSCPTITGLSASITLTESTSKVLVSYTIFVSASAACHGGTILRRSGTNIFLSDAGTGISGTAGHMLAPSNSNWGAQMETQTYLDNPGVGTHTYTVGIGGNGTATLYVNRTGRLGTTDPLGTSQITLYEILGE